MTALHRMVYFYTKIHDNNISLRRIFLQNIKNIIYRTYTCVEFTMTLKDYDVLPSNSLFLVTLGDLSLDDAQYSLHTT